MIKCYTNISSIIAWIKNSKQKKKREREDCNYDLYDFHSQTYYLNIYISTL